MQTNRFEVSGYLAAKPALRQLPSGMAVANVRLGQTYLYETKEGRQKQTNWFNLAFYGSVAKVAMEYDKGNNVNIVGSIQQRQFTPKDGSPRTVFEVVVQKCHRIASPRDSGASVLNTDREATPAISVQEDVDAWAVL